MKVKFEKRFLDDYLILEVCDSGIEVLKDSAVPTVGSQHSENDCECTISRDDITKRGEFLKSLVLKMFRQPSKESFASIFSKLVNFLNACECTAESSSVILNLVLSRFMDPSDFDGHRCSTDDFRRIKGTLANTVIMSDAFQKWKAKHKSFFEMSHDTEDFKLHQSICKNPELNEDMVFSKAEILEIADALVTQENNWILGKVI